MTNTPAAARPPREPDFSEFTEALWQGATALEYVAEYVEQDHSAAVRKRQFASLLRAAYNIPDVVDRLGALPTDSPAGEPREDEGECDEDCPRCSGEYCEWHGNEPCECDVVDRHTAPPAIGAPNVSLPAEPRGQP